MSIACSMTSEYTAPNIDLQVREDDDLPPPGIDYCLKRPSDVRKITAPPRKAADAGPLFKGANG